MPPIPPPQPLPPIAINPPQQPQPQPAPQPPPQAAPVVIGSWPNAALVLAGLFVAMVTMLGGLAMVIAAVVYFGGFWHHPSGPTSVDFVKLGQEYGKQLPPSYGGAWKSYAADIRNGKSLGDSTKSMNDAWKANRDAIYKALVLPELAKILPDGTPDDKVTPAQRAALAAAADDLAKGLGVPP